MLSIVINDLEGKRPLTGLCAGYELKQWRAAAFADHLLESLPEFCLTFSEYTHLNHESAVKLIRHAARRIYETDKFKNRGEFGELLLHVALRQTANTLPAVSKIYYKDSANDTVKGFDAVHVVPTDEGLELWLGEVKFYSNITAAVRDVVNELQAHLHKDYLKGEFLAIINKIDKEWPYADTLIKLLDEKTSLDEVFSSFCIPVLLTYDGDATCKHKESTPDYIEELLIELQEIRKNFVEKSVSIPHKIHLFLVPLSTKDKLISYLDEKLKHWQSI